MSAKSVLFVDGEPQVLESLRRQRRPWSMRFARGADEAMRELERAPADVVVAHMTAARGRTLLALLEAWHPRTRRVVLGARVTADVSARADAVVKTPCDPDALVRAIEDAPR
jgi:DNA-binding NarL/FixJ family response regulator